MSQTLESFVLNLNLELNLVSQVISFTGQATNALEKAVSKTFICWLYLECQKSLIFFTSQEHIVYF